MMEIGLDPDNAGQVLPGIKTVFGAIERESDRQIKSSLYGQTLTKQAEKLAKGSKLKRVDQDQQQASDPSDPFGLDDGDDAISRGYQSGDARTEDIGGTGHITQTHFGSFSAKISASTADKLEEAMMPMGSLVGKPKRIKLDINSDDLDVATKKFVEAHPAFDTPEAKKFMDDYKKQIDQQKDDEVESIDLSYQPTKPLSQTYMTVAEDSTPIQKFLFEMYYRVGPDETGIYAQSIPGKPLSGPIDVESSASKLLKAVSSSITDEGKIGTAYIRQESPLSKRTGGYYKIVKYETKKIKKTVTVKGKPQFEWIPEWKGIGPPSPDDTGSFKIKPVSETKIVEDEVFKLTKDGKRIMAVGPDGKPVESKAFELADTGEWILEWKGIGPPSPDDIGSFKIKLSTTQQVENIRKALPPGSELKYTPYNYGVNNYTQSIGTLNTKLTNLSKGTIG